MTRTELLRVLSALRCYESELLDSSKSLRDLGYREDLATLEWTEQELKNTTTLIDKWTRSWSN